MEVAVEMAVAVTAAAAAAAAAAAWRRRWWWRQRGGRRDARTGVAELQGGGPLLLVVRDRPGVQLDVRCEQCPQLRHGRLVRDLLPRPLGLHNAAGIPAPQNNRSPYTDVHC